LALAALIAVPHQRRTQVIHFLTHKQSITFKTSKVLSTALYGQKEKAGMAEEGGRFQYELPERFFRAL